MRASSFLWIGLLALIAVPGCGLTLDYSPPDLDAGMDATRDDAGPVQCADDAVCDDGLRCTNDVCREGTCANDPLCPAGTECIARDLGECRRPCGNAGDCDDGRECTDDACNLADGHCMLTSTCGTDRPVCLSNGSCAPATCVGDEDCHDGDACNGVERCEAGACVAGDPMVCPATVPGSCIQSECDPVHGGCVTVLRSDLCDDGVECTVDECTPDTADADHCVHRAVDSLCDDGLSCTSEVCDVEAGCVATPMPCPFEAGGCILAGHCDDASGSCTYERGPCMAGQVCTDAGCVAGTCESDGDCLDLTDPSGCGFRCDSGTSLCVPRARCSMSFGCAVPDLECVDDASLCHYSGGSPESNARCDDLDAATQDTCVYDDAASTFVCAYTCLPDPRACFTTTYDPIARICRRAPNDDVCTRAHGATTPPDCTEWLCGAATGDGCERRPVAARCDDGASCTADACVATGAAGSCSNIPLADACDDDAECTMDSCDPAAARGTPTGCLHVRDDTICGSAGPLDFACADVFCAGTPGVGAELGSRTYPTGCGIRYSSCGGTVPACAGDSSFCPDGSTGTFRDGGTWMTLPLVCDSTSGECVPASTGCRSSTDCDDGNACTGVESCVSGTCYPGAAVVCPADGSGCEGVCNPTTGVCELLPGMLCVPAT